MSKVVPMEGEMTVANRVFRTLEMLFSIKDKGSSFRVGMVRGFKWIRERN
jgi:hypothetical protein